MAAALAGAGGLATSAAAQNNARPKKEPLPADLVREWVLVAHKDLERVKELFSQQPALLNAAWDWGGGDWETALGAAAHTGRREIALFLIEKGARMDLFAAAMLGELKTVSAMLDAHPGLINSKGPHGIPLLTHAKIGKEPAKEVLEFLEALKPELKAG
jgi:hypothetical protein